MAIIRYTCSVCGLVTRCEDGDPNYVACIHKDAPFEFVNEDEEASAPAPQPEE